MKFTIYSLILVVYMGLTVSAFAGPDRVEIDCLELQELSGQKMPCENFSTLKVEPAKLAVYKKRHKLKLCVESVEKKYSKQVCDATITLSGIHPESLQSKAKEVSACHTAKNVCKLSVDPPKKQKEQETINIWD